MIYFLSVFDGDHFDCDPQMANAIDDEVRLSDEEEVYAMKEIVILVLLLLLLLLLL